MKNSNGKTLAKDKNEFVSCIMTNDEGNVILFKRRKDLKLDPGKYDFISGHMQEGEENAEESICREIEEETSIKVTPKDLKKIGIIETPHKKLEGTLCHIFHMKIDIEPEELNKMIINVPNPEMEKAVYLKNADILLQMQEETDLLRTTCTKQMRYVLEAVKQKINANKRKSIKEGEKQCEER